MSNAQAGRNVWDEGRWASVKDVKIDFMTSYIMEKIVACTSPQGKTTVELGSGTGRLSYLMLKGGARKVTMVDSSRKAIDLARGLFREQDPSCYTLVQSDIFEFTCEEKFDIVFSSGVIEHFKGRDRSEIIRKHVLLSKSDCIILHPSDTLYQRLFSSFPPAVRLYGFAKPYSLSEMNGYISDIREADGLSHQQFYTFYSVPMLHNREALNRVIDRTRIGTSFGGLILTHLKVAKER